MADGWWWRRRWRGTTHLWVGPEEGRMGGWVRTGRPDGGEQVGTFSGEEAAEEAVNLQAVWADLSNHMNADASNRSPPRLHPGRLSSLLSVLLPFHADESKSEILA